MAPVAAAVHPPGALELPGAVRRHRPAVPARRRPASGHSGHDTGEGSAPALRPRQITAERRAAPAVVGVACAVTLVARVLARVLALARRRHARPGGLRGEFAGGRSPAALVAGRVAERRRGESPIHEFAGVRGEARRRSRPPAPPPPSPWLPPEGRRRRLTLPRRRTAAVARRRGPRPDKNDRDEQTVARLRRRRRFPFRSRRRARRLAWSASRWTCAPGRWRDPRGEVTLVPGVVLVPVVVVVVAVVMPEWCPSAARVMVVVVVVVVAAVAAAGRPSSRRRRRRSSVPCHRRVRSRDLLPRPPSTRRPRWSRRRGSPGSRRFRPPSPCPRCEDPSPPPPSPPCCRESPEAPGRRRYDRPPRAGPVPRDRTRRPPCRRRRSFDPRAIRANPCRRRVPCARWNPRRWPTAWRTPSPSRSTSPR